MFSKKLTYIVSQPRLLLPKAILATHSPLCPTKNPPSTPAKGAVCPGSGGKGTSTGGSVIKRAVQPGMVRLSFVPEEWFLFFHPKTGVSGPYLFGFLLINYLVSKEYYVLEHEYYSGLSWIVIIYFVVNKLGPGIAASLDKEVDAVQKEFYDSRNAEINGYEALIKNAKDAQMRAEAQKILMDAKKENVAMQLEAVYRERAMLVYKTVKGRMDYHMKRYQSEARIQQRWMIGWVLQNVQKSITPEFEKQALDSAIQDLAAAAGRA